MGKDYQLNHSYSARSSSSVWSIKREIHAAALPKDDAMYRYGWKSLDKACQKKTWMRQLSALAIHVEQLDKPNQKSFVYVVYEKFRPLQMIQCRRSCFWMPIQSHSLIFPACSIVRIPTTTFTRYGANRCKHWPSTLSTILPQPAPCFQPTSRTTPQR